MKKTEILKECLFELNERLKLIEKQYLREDENVIESGTWRELFELK